MSAEDFARSLGIKSSGVEQEGRYVISLKDSDHFGYAYSKLENIEELESLDEDNKINEEETFLWYESTNEPFIINLYGDFNNDIYQIIIARKD